jgi:2-aminoethylphosphonate-pyruvate transaminase
LFAQWEGLEQNGQFGFTPPTHALLAFAKALEELREEGGISARAARCHANHKTLQTGMRQLGFVEYLAAERQSNIITTFRCPDDPNFRFEDFLSLSPRARLPHLSWQVESCQLLPDRNHWPY